MAKHSSLAGEFSMHSVVPLTIGKAPFRVQYTYEQVGVR